MTWQVSASQTSTSLSSAVPAATLRSLAATQVQLVTRLRRRCAVRSGSEPGACQSRRSAAEAVTRLDLAPSHRTQVTRMLCRLRLEWNCPPGRHTRTVQSSLPLASRSPALL